MNLSEAISIAVNSQVNAEGHFCLFAIRPWGKLAEAKIVDLGEDIVIPSEIKRSEFEYFLEVSIIKEMRSTFHKKSDDTFVDMVMHYAEFDAYPEYAWDEM